MTKSIKEGDLIVVKTKHNRSELEVTNTMINRIYFDVVRDDINAFATTNYIDDSWITNDTFEHIDRNNWTEKNNCVIWKED